MVRSRESLTLAEIVEMNRRILEVSGGGTFEEHCQNFQNRNSLVHILDTLDSSVFGREQYPSIAQKAAQLCWVIITRHVFKNGNKRTGLLACHQFLRLNGYAFQLVNEDAEQMVLRVGSERSGDRPDDVRIAELVTWVEQRMAPTPVSTQRGQIESSDGFVYLADSPPVERA